MFATGPANNCFVEMLSTDGYATIDTVKGMERIRTLEIMLDLEFLDIDSSSANIKILADTITTNFAFMDLDYNGAVADPISGLRAVVARGSAKTATPGDTTPLFGQRMTLWLKDDQETITFRTNGVAGTDVTYTAAEAAAKIIAPSGPITLLSGGISSRLYEAGIRVNDTLVFHVRPRLYMADTETPDTIPDLSGYGNNLTIHGTLGTSYRYAPSWSRQVPYSGKETVG